MIVEANLFSFSDEVQLSSEAMGVYEIQARLRDTSQSLSKIKECDLDRPLEPAWYIFVQLCLFLIPQE